MSKTFSNVYFARGHLTRLDLSVNTFEVLTPVFTKPTLSVVNVVISLRMKESNLTICVTMQNKSMIKPLEMLRKKRLKRQPPKKNSEKHSIKNNDLAIYDAQEMKSQVMGHLRYMVESEYLPILCQKKLREHCSFNIDKLVILISEKANLRPNLIQTNGEGDFLFKDNDIFDDDESDKWLLYSLNNGKTVKTQQGPPRMNCSRCYLEAEDVVNMQGVKKSMMEYRSYVKGGEPSKLKCERFSSKCKILNDEDSPLYLRDIEMLIALDDELADQATEANSRSLEAAQNQNNLMTYLEFYKHDYTLLKVTGIDELYQLQQRITELLCKRSGNSKAEDALGNRCFVMQYTIKECETQLVTYETFMYYQAVINKGDALITEKGIPITNFCIEEVKFLSEEINLLDVKNKLLIDLVSDEQSLKARLGSTFNSSNRCANKEKCNPISRPLTMIGLDTAVSFKDGKNQSYKLREQILILSARGLELDLEPLSELTLNHVVFFFINVPVFPYYTDQATWNPKMLHVNDASCCLVQLMSSCHSCSRLHLENQICFPAVHENRELELLAVAKLLTDR